MNLRHLGSLWLAAVLLALLMVAMAYATAWEALNGPESAKALFYQSVWFKSLLALLTVNIFTAIALRYPLNSRQIGFLLSHLGIVLILAGAVVTAMCGVEGQIGLLEGESTDTFISPPHLALHIRDQQNESFMMDLDSNVFDGASVMQRLDRKPETWNDLHIKLLRYWPDFAWRTQVTNDLPNFHRAIKVSLAPHPLATKSSHTETTWLFEDQRSQIGGRDAVLKVASDPDALTRLLEADANTTNQAQGLLRIRHDDPASSQPARMYEIPLQSCMEQPTHIGDTGYTARVLRYLPHAVVDKDLNVTNMSDQPINPAVEVEIAGPEGTTRQLAFAHFPEFGRMHPQSQLSGWKVTFAAAGGDPPATPIEFIVAPDDTLFVRFVWQHTRSRSHKVILGEPVETPWERQYITVQEYYTHAKTSREPHAIVPPRDPGQPAIEVQLGTQDQEATVWVPKYHPITAQLGDRTYQLLYATKQVNMGFEVTLNQFRVGLYPGTQRPRSFESHITIIDDATGRAQDHIVSMNHPASHGGYTFYQSSYDQRQGRTASFLSVSRDPGQPVVFAGYIMTIVGMLWVLRLKFKYRTRTETER